MNNFAQFLKEDRRYLNGWSITRSSSPFGSPGDIVLVYNKNGERMKKVVPFQKSWYFYVRNSERDLRVLEKIYPHGKKQIGKEWVRVFYPKILYKDSVLTGIINELEKGGVKTYEADVSPMKRLCLDFDLKVEDWENVRKLYFDIETDDSKGGIVIGRDRILSFAGVDPNGQEYFLADEDEFKLLKSIKELVMSYDMLVGWNSKDFDLPYLRERFKRHKIEFNYMENILHEDMMRRVQYFYSKDPEARQSISSYSLDYISNYFLGESKVKRTGKIIDLYHQDPKKFKEYNLQDCKLLKNLEDKLGTIRLTYMMFQWCGVFCQNWSMVKTIDNFILSEANKKGVHYRTNLNQMNNAEELETVEFLGAFVIDPVPGFYKEVYDLDFKSLYPNIIRSFNISPDTIISGKGITCPEIVDEKGKHGGLTFSSDKMGIIPGKIELLLNQRAEIRKEMKGLKKDSPEWRNLNVKQLIVKELSNSIYGVLGNKWFRSFDVSLAESITATGQYLIKFVKAYNEKQGRTVLYGDTDSIFLTTKKGEEIQEVVKEINSAIDQHLRKDFGVRNNTIQIDVDVKFDKFIIEAKKKYVGKIGETYKYVGMECIKRDTVKCAVKFQKELISKTMAGDKDLEEWVFEKREAFLKKEVPVEDILIRKRISKKLESYAGKSGKNYTAPIHVRIARDLVSRKTLSEDNKSQVSSPGSIIQYVITQGGTGVKLTGVHISEYAGKFDRLYYWNNNVGPILQRLLTAVHPERNWDDLLLRKERKTLTKLKK